MRYVFRNAFILTGTLYAPEYECRDGFIGNPKTILRMIGASEDDFKILVTKGFVIVFESGIIVITHWKRNNYIQKDRYKETIYKDEKSFLNMI